jgi:hypothetical protein
MAPGGSVIAMSMGMGMEKKRYGTRGRRERGIYLGPTSCGVYEIEATSFMILIFWHSGVMTSV